MFIYHNHLTQITGLNVPTYLIFQRIWFFVEMTTKARKQNHHKKLWKLRTSNSIHHVHDNFIIMGTRILSHVHSNNNKCTTIGLSFSKRISILIVARDFRELMHQKSKHLGNRKSQLVVVLPSMHLKLLNACLYCTSPHDSFPTKLEASNH